MAISFQTNVPSLNAQENLRVNNDFQARTIQRLTSGFRINSSGDDAAGLAVANKFRADVAELTQGVRNANDGVSQLQIIDGGINNISKILDRMVTLATQSASDTFAGGVAGRNTMNNEYQALMNELTRQADNVGLGTGIIGGRFNRSVSVYIGGGMGLQDNAQVIMDLSGQANQIDAAGLGLSATKINDAAGVAMGDVNIRNSTALYAGGGSQTFSFYVAGSTTPIDAVVNGTTAGITGQEVVDQLNQQLQSEGITAALNDTTGFLEFSSTRGFVASTAAGPADGAATVAVTMDSAMAGGNKAMYHAGFTLAASTELQELTFKVGTTTVATVSIASGASAATIDSNIRAALSGTVIDYAGDGSTTGAFFSSSEFTIESNVATSVITEINGDSTVDLTSTDPFTSAAPTLIGDGVARAKAALVALGQAVSSLSTVAGKVGTAQNMLQYAISLAQSQIANFSAAESRIRDADVAAEAANLTKAQVLQQASMAAMAQANSAPQAVLALLRG